MKYFTRFLLLASILLSIYYTIAALNIFSSITSDPEGWQAGVDMNSTIVWFIVITFGFGFLSLQTIAALIGLFLGYQGRRSAFWFFSLPGLIGIILGIVWLLLFMAFDVEWPASWVVIAVLLIVPTIAYMNGKYVRKILFPKSLQLNKSN